jgi:hypothetical protein
MEGYEVVTVDDQKVGKVVSERPEYLIVEQGMIRKSKHALPREFAHVDESAQQVRMTVPKEIFADSPEVDEEPDARLIAEYYGLATAGSETPGTEGYGETVSGDPSRSAAEQEARAGIEPAVEERAEIREGRSADFEESPALLGDRYADVDKREKRD